MLSIASMRTSHSTSPCFKESRNSRNLERNWQADQLVQGFQGLSTFTTCREESAPTLELCIDCLVC
eukprot:m.147538 g.147538  ORF g.147538 m.147538 type:complete len:66 (-) comp52730_c0_seq31:214-411(-)